MPTAAILILVLTVLIFALLIAALVREAGLMTTGIRKARAYSAAQALNTDDERAAWLNAR